MSVHLSSQEDLPEIPVKAWKRAIIKRLRKSAIKKINHFARSHPQVGNQLRTILYRIAVHWACAGKISPPPPPPSKMIILNQILACLNFFLLSFYLTSEQVILVPYCCIFRVLLNDMLYISIDTFS